VARKDVDPDAPDAFVGGRYGSPPPSSVTVTVTAGGRPVVFESGGRVFVHPYAFGSIFPAKVCRWIVPSRITNVSVQNS
jgi:hypothetical protein